MNGRLVKARVGVFGVFFAMGLGMAAWVVSIPAIQQRTGVSHATLGGLLLLLGLGGVIGMQVAGYLIARFGSKIVTAVGLAAFVFAVNLPVHVNSAAGLGIALLVFGLFNGTVDVAMNDQAVIVERAYGRPIMSAFHALWSVGGALGALLGAGVQAVALPVTVSAAVTSVVLVVLAVTCVRWMLGTAHESAPESLPTQENAAGGSTGASVRRRVIGFGVLAFLLMLSEGVANDWGPLHSVEHLGQPAATAALAYATFAIAMTIGRLTVDRVAHRFGPAFVVRWGSAAAAVGIGTVMLSPVFGLALVGWAVFGLGLSGVVPQLFTAAGNISSTNQAILLSRVVGAGYVGQLAGPALIGAVAGLVGLNLAFALPLLFCAVAVIVAPIVSRSQTSDPVEVQEPARAG